MTALSWINATAQTALLVEHPMHWLNERTESVSSPHLAHSTNADALPLNPVIEPSLCSLTGTSADFKLITLKKAASSQSLLYVICPFF
jgi:hypothetical protein